MVYLHNKGLHSNMVESLKQLGRRAAFFFLGDAFISPRSDPSARIFWIFILAFCGGAFMVPYGVVALCEGNYTIGAFDLTSAFLLMGIYLFSRLRGVNDFSALLASCVTMFLMVFLFAMAAVDNTGHMWTYTAPVFLMFTLGRRKGFVAVVLLLIFFIVLMLPQTHTPVSYLSTTFKFRFASSFFAVVLVALFGEIVRKRIEVSLAAKNEELEYSLKVRKIVEEQLRRARTEALKVSQTKSEFLANVSHEIRTPINAVIGFADLLKHSRLTDVQLDYVMTIRSSGDVLINLINDILDFSKIEAGSIELEYIDFNLPNLIESLLKMIRPNLKNKPVRLEYFISSQIMPFYRGDPTRLRQVLLNLLSNAIKFTQKGRILLSVSLEETSGAVESSAGAVMQKLVFGVEDTGIGISENKRSRVFEAFAQADASTTREFGGTGLGLAITKALVEKMGGSISLNSAVGQGTRFEVTLDMAVTKQHLSTKIMPVDLDSLDDISICVFAREACLCKVLNSNYRAVCANVDLRSFDAYKSYLWLKAQEPGFNIIYIAVCELGSEGVKLAHLIRSNEHLKGSKLIAVASPDEQGRERLGVFDAVVKGSDVKSEIFKIEQKAEQERILIESNSESGFTNFSNLRMLVAEDNMVNQKLIKIMLDKIGCSSDIVNNGQEAVDAVDRSHYDLVFMDLQMPVMSGLEAASIIRNRLKSDIPIVALTAAAMDETRQKAYQCGINEYLAKPVVAEQLKRTILTLCS